ncbi:L,D-transpeptidase family protein [Pedococcus bigeumensis]|uniref:Murein L,D-transpeptidase n=1 Tax=Pedococcus bigeumensis TaxID=433644 RepID=A0A502CTU3_9MICO|nr:L,D-transpeptidase family protein [Pedococcus bigeumensis]TPG15940.1 murein L,D-transpeptidase [Pedococcus bigeumensis]
MDRSNTGARAALAASVLAAALVLTACGGISFGTGASFTPLAAQGTTAVSDPSSVPVEPAPADTTTTVPAPSTTTPSPTTTPATPKPTAKPTPKPKPTPKEGDTLKPGDSGAYVKQVQQRLTALGYWNGSADGSYGGLTSQAVMALQKAAGLGRDGVYGPSTRRALQNGVRPQSRTGGTGIEIDKARQLLLVVRGGRVTMILNTSTGSGERYTSEGSTRVATTPAGSFSTFRTVDHLDKGPLGALWRPRYFNGGIAVHGAGLVPGYPASHGCARVSNPAMDMIWANNIMPIGGRVTVY